METYQAPVIRHFPQLKRYEPVIEDSSAMMTYKTCPRLYLLRIILGFVPKENPPYFAFGTAYHKFREVLEITHKAGGDDTEAMKAAMIAGLHSYQKSGVVVKIGTRFDFLTPERLLQSFKVTWDWWRKEKEDKRLIVVETEQPIMTQGPDGKWVAGRADQMVRWNGEPWGRDFKTSSKMGDFYKRTLEPNDQFTRYTYIESVLNGAEVDLSNKKGIIKGQLVEVLYNTKNEGPKIIPFQTTRTLEQLQEWMKDRMFWAEMIDKSRLTDNYPMNEKSCAFCKMHSVCTKTSESAQLYELKSHFKIEPWDCTLDTDE